MTTLGGNQRDPLAEGAGRKAPADDEPASPSAFPAGKSRLRLIAGHVWREYPNLGLTLFTILFIIVIAFAKSEFSSTVNIRNVGRLWAILLMASIAGMLVILSGGIDLSIGANIALVTVGATMISQESGVAVALLAGIGIGLAVGAINGFLVARLKLDPVIVTVGMLQMLTGIAFLWSRGVPLRSDAPDFNRWGTGFIGPAAYPTLFAVPLILMTYFFLKRTVWGRYFYAIGGSEEAARAAGISVAKYKHLGYALAGLMGGVTGVTLASRVGGGGPTLGADLLITSVAVIFIGGVGFGGGVGGVAGVAVGALLITVLQNGLQFLGVSFSLQMLITGLILVLALYSNRLRAESR